MKTFKKFFLLSFFLSFCSCSQFQFKKIKKESQKLVYKKNCKGLSELLLKKKVKQKAFLFKKGEDCFLKNPKEALKIYSYTEGLKLSLEERKRAQEKKAFLFYKLSPQNAIKAFTVLSLQDSQNLRYKEALVGSFYKTKKFLQAENLVVELLKGSELSRQKRAQLLTRLFRSKKAL